MPKLLQVDFGFPGMPPDELSVEMACLGVHLDADRFDIDAAFEHVKLRACDEGIDGAAVAADPARNLCVPHSRGIASPGEDAASLFLADRFDELLAQFAKGGSVHEHHAVLVEPDQAVVR